MTVADAPTKQRAPATARGNGARPIPYNEDAERALLGAALLTHDARDILAAVLTPNDFYGERHGHIAHAITALHLDAQPVDVVTVAAQLRDAKLLDLAGGGSYLVELQSSTPATSSAPRYADIVLENARRRQQMLLADRLIDAASVGAHDTIASTLAELRHHQETAGTDELELEDMTLALADDRDDYPTILARSDGLKLLYPAAVNVIQSEPTLGKSWIALIAVVEVLLAGGDVLYLDYEDAPRRIVRRLRQQLGLDPRIIIERFHYKRPGHLSAKGIAALPRLATRLNADLVVIDGVADAMAMQNHEENEAADVLAWWTTVPRPLSYTGACVLLLDHVTKSKENRGRWARGNGAKLGAIDGAAYSLDALTPLSKRQAGKLKLTVAKDRHGVIGAMGDIAGLVDITPFEDGERFEWTTSAPPPDTHGEWAGPTDCMAMVNRLFTENPGLGEVAKSAVPVHLKALFGSSFRRDTVYAALERMVLDGDLLARSGARNGRFYRLHPDHPNSTSEHEPVEMF